MGDQQRETGAMRGVAAALRLAQHNPQAATAALAPVLDGSAPVIAPAQVGTFVLEAIARDAAGDPAAAEDALERALELAEPDGVLLPFLVQRAPDLLERHSRRRTAHAALAARILLLFAPGSSNGPGPAPGKFGGAGSSPRSRGGLVGIVPREAALLEPVSEMEMRVQRFLPTNLTASEIAGELYLSVHTVKTHIRHLYVKFGVHGRGEAVQRARTLGLLAPSPRRH
jgi:LuxR family transcriptional regulator, maltose regulon positive regulatory protein